MISTNPGQLTPLVGPGSRGLRLFCYRLLCVLLEPLHRREIHISWKTPISGELWKMLLPDPRGKQKGNATALLFERLPLCAGHHLNRISKEQCLDDAMTLQEQFERYLDQSPEIDESAYVAPSAVLIGSVTLGPRSSVWPLCVLRGDINSIEIGEGSNVQDGTIVHLADDYGVKVGKYVTIGHAAMIHACTIEDDCLIGMRATVLDGAVIGKGSIVGAGALVTKGTVVPPGSLVLGMPAKVVRQLTPEEIAGNRKLAEKYVQVAAAHKQRQSARRS